MDFKLHFFESFEFAEVENPQFWIYETAEEKLEIRQREARKSAVISVRRRLPPPPVADELADSRETFLKLDEQGACWCCPTGS